MTKEEIIRVAREADQYADDHAPAWTQIPHEWQELRDHHFATLVAAAAKAEEREACAKVCESFIPKYERFDDQRVAGNKSRAIAAAIRARSNP